MEAIKLLSPMMSVILNVEILASRAWGGCVLIFPVSSH